MDFKNFCAEMLRTGSVMNRQCTDMMLETYYLEFESWTEQQFFGAMARCRQDLDFFPTIRQIRERFVTSAQTYNTRQESNGGFIEAEDTPDHMKGNSLEANVDALSDEELIEMFLRDGLSEPTAHNTLRRFRKSPTGVVFRGYIKDLLSPRWNEYKEPRYKCIKCCDKGTIEVFSSNTCRQAKSGTLVESKVRTWQVACNCEKANVGKSVRKDSDHNRCRELPTFEESWMVKVQGVTSSEMFNQIYDHYAEKKQSQGVGDFDDWGSSNE